MSAYQAFKIIFKQITLRCLEQRAPDSAWYHMLQNNKPSGQAPRIYTLIGPSFFRFCLTIFLSLLSETVFAYISTFSNENKHETAHPGVRRFRLNFLSVLSETVFALTFYPFQTKRK
jgi:hypothetical protein